MVRYSLLCILFFGCTAGGDKIPVGRDGIDSLRRSIIDRSNIYQMADNMDSLGHFLDSVHSTVEKINDADVKLTWLICKIQQVRRQEKEDSQSYYLNSAVKLSKSPAVSKRKLLNFYIIYGNEIVKANRDSALRIGMEAYHLAIQLDSFRYAETCFDLSEIYASVEDNVNWRKYLFEAWRCRHREPELTAYIAKRIAGYYDALGKTDSALHFLEVIDTDSSFIWNSELRSESYENKAYFLSKEGRHEEAINNLLKAKDINDEISKSNYDVLYELSDAFADIKQYQKAHLSIDSALVLARLTGDFSLIKNTWKQKAVIYAKQRMHQEAYQSLDSAFANYTIEMDTAFRITARELETKYAVREKDARIQTLDKINFASLKIRQQQRIIIFSLIAAAALATISGVLLWKRRQAEIRYREADLRQQVLRTQMEPHFLFNMLSLLQALIRTNHREKSILLLNKFSRLLRSILENSRKKFVSLSEEIGVLDSYLSLQCMLLENKFEYSIDVDYSIQQKTIAIPPMLLQPFVENAIQHGFHNLQHKGNLKIQIRRSNGSLVCLIEDNGNGIGKPMMADGRIHASDITKERLAILGKQTRKQTKLKLTDKSSINAGRGVEVEIEIPLMTTE